MPKDELSDETVAELTALSKSVASVQRKLKAILGTAKKTGAANNSHVPLVMHFKQCWDSNFSPKKYTPTGFDFKAAMRFMREHEGEKLSDLIAEIGSMVGYHWKRGEFIPTCSTTLAGLLTNWNRLVATMRSDGHLAGAESNDRPDRISYEEAQRQYGAYSRRELKREELATALGFGGDGRQETESADTETISGGDVEQADGGEGSRDAGKGGGKVEA